MERILSEVWEVDSQREGGGNADIRLVEAALVDKPGVEKPTADSGLIHQTKKASAECLWEVGEAEGGRQRGRASHTKRERVRVERDKKREATTVVCVIYRAAERRHLRPSEQISARRLSTTGFLRARASERANKTGRRGPNSSSQRYHPVQ